MPEQPWTWCEFHKAMKAADWIRLKGDPPGCKSYRHESGRVYVATDVVMDDGQHIEDWQKWAEAHQTPSPFRRYHEQQTADESD